MCQHPQSRAARFCVACGAPHVEICRACGQAVPMPATFCPGCGHRLEALLPTEPAPRPLASLAPPVAVPERVPLAYTPMALVEKIRTSRAALEGEHKQVTVLFADLKDSLELIRGLDPEAAQQLLDPALHAMMDAVHRYEGTGGARGGTHYPGQGDGAGADARRRPPGHHPGTPRTAGRPARGQPFLRLDAPQRRQHTLTALKRVLLRQSQVQPLLLVCEDLHWLDTETQALLESLGESLPTARLLLLVNYRPDYRHGWGSKTYYTQLRLDPLPPVSADAFLRTLLGDDPSLIPLTELLIERTEGNPFFLEESVCTCRAALALAEELGMRPLVAHCHLGLGRLYGQAGRGEQARADLSAAIELYRAMDMTFWLPQAEAALAQVT